MWSVNVSVCVCGVGGVGMWSENVSGRTRK